MECVQKETNKKAYVADFGVWDYILDDGEEQHEYSREEFELI
jgi:hypothetical protein